MKKNDLKPGTQVLAIWNCPEWDSPEIIKYRHNDYDYNTMLGVVLEKEAAPDKVFVQWEEGTGEADIDFEEPQEIDINLLTLLSDQSKIEQEYKELQKVLKTKMKEASAIIREAGKLATKHGYSLADMGSSDLYNAMDNAGWRTSSFGC